MKRKVGIFIGIFAMFFLMFSQFHSVFADSYREMPYDVETMRSPEDVQKMLDYATSWVGKISYASSQNESTI